MPLHSMDMFRSIIEATNGGILVAELETLRFVYANPAICEMLGYVEQELLQMDVRQLHRAADFEWVFELFQQQAAGKRKLARDIPCLRKDGRLVYMDISSTSAEVDGSECNIGFFIEVSERRDASQALRDSEKELRESNELLEGVLNAIPDVIGVQDTRHLIQRYNQAGYAYLELGPEVHGRKCYELIGRTQPCPFCPVETTLRTRGPAQLEKHIPEMDVWLDCRAYPVFGADGEIRCVVEHLRDITEHRKLEEKLRHAAKMQAVGELAGGLAHDFNNQLGGILGLAELLRSDLHGRPEQLEVVDTIIQTVERASGLTSQLLAFARRGKFLSVGVDLHELIEEVCRLLERSLDKRIRIERRLGAESAMTIGDPSQLQNVLLNLALNARDAMPDGGELIFESSITWMNAGRPAAQAFELEEGEYVQVCVTDTGVGMDEKTRERIFEPFFTTKQKGQGIGMGLAAVYGALKNHKGAVSVYSELGHGSTFKVYLPLHREVPYRKRMPEDNVKPASQKATVLVVDDEAIILEVANAMLRRLGYEVITCASSREAITLYEQHWREIDCVLLDMVMPEKAGQQAFEEMRLINPEVRVILASGYSLNGEAQRILDRGVRAFLQKPFRLADLAKVLERVLEG